MLKRFVNNNIKQVFKFKTASCKQYSTEGNYTSTKCSFNNDEIQHITRELDKINRSLMMLIYQTAFINISFGFVIGFGIG